MSDAYENQLDGSPTNNQAMAESVKREKKAAAMKKDLQGWSFGLLGIGVLSVLLHNYLDPVWGILLIVVGVLSLIFQKRPMFIVFGAVLCLAGFMNLFSGGSMRLFGAAQIYWGILEFIKYNKYASVGNVEIESAPIPGRSTTTCPHCGNQVTPSRYCIQCGNMNLDFLGKELSKDGWKDLLPGSYAGFDFDLTGSRFQLSKYILLVKVIPTLDREALTRWLSSFETIKKKSRDFLVGKSIFLCLITGAISGEALQSMSTDRLIVGATSALGEIFGTVGGGSYIYIADIRNRKVYGRVPSLPFITHELAKKVKEIFMSSLVHGDIG